MCLLYSITIFKIFKLNFTQFKLIGTFGQRKTYFYVKSLLHFFFFFYLTPVYKYIEFNFLILIITLLFVIRNLIIETAVLFKRFLKQILVKKKY